MEKIITTTTTTEEYEPRPFWQVILLFCLTFFCIAMTIVAVFWIASKILPDTYTDTRIIQSSEGQYIQYSNSKTSSCFLNNVEVNCSNVTAIKEAWWNQ